MNGGFSNAVVEPGPRKRPLWHYDLSYALFIAVLFREVVFGRAIFSSIDNVQMYYPMGEVIARAFRGIGSFLWDSGTDHGLPLIGRWQTQLFYPTTWLLSVLAPSTAWATSFLLHMLIAASATFRLALRYSGDAVSAWISGLGYACCGYVLSMTSFGFRAIGIALLPVSLVLLHRLCEKPVLVRSLALSLVFSLQIFTADAETLYFELLICVPAVLLLKTSSRGDLLRAAVWTALAGMLAAIIAACQILPMLEFTGKSVRTAGLTLEEATYWSFHPLRLLEYAVPHLFGSIFPTFDWWGRLVINGPFHIPLVVCIYVGILPIVGLAALPARTRRRDTAVWGIILIVSLLLALGIHTPVYKVVFSLVPGVNKFRYPEKLVGFVSLSLVILGAMGLGRLRRDDPFFPQARTRMLATLAVVVLLLSAALFKVSLEPEAEKWFASVISTSHALANPVSAVEHTSWALERSLLIAVALATLLMFLPRLKPALAAGLLGLLVVTDILTASLPSRQISEDEWLKTTPGVCTLIPHDQGSPPPLVWRPLDAMSPAQRAGEPDEEYAERFRKWKYETLLPNSGMPSCIRYVEGYSAGQVSRHDRLFKELGSKSHLLLTVSGVQYIFDINKRLEKPIIGGPPFAVLKELDLEVYKYPGLPYAYAVAETTRAPDEDASMARLKEPSFNPWRETVIELAGPLASSAPASREISLVSWKPGTIELSARFSQPGYATVLETFYPGWWARLDNGENIPVVPANAAFIGIAVPAGKHRIVLEFDPPLQGIANRISIFGMVVALVLYMSSLVKPDRTRLANPWRG